MMLLTIVGARPQFVEAAAVGYAIEASKRSSVPIESILVHTGQHCDFDMFRVFFDEFGLQPPARDLASDQDRMNDRPAACSRL